MAKQWAKIYRDVTESERLEALLAKNPFAEALYWRLKAASDDFGRHPASPKDVGCATCPRNLVAGTVKLKRIETALQDLAACGLIRIYSVEDRQYLEITDYLKHAHDSWTNVGKPEYPPPADWIAPPPLVEFLLAHKSAKNIGPDRFGVGIDNWPEGIPYPWDTYTIPMGRVGGYPTPDVDVDSDVDRDGDGDPRAHAPANDPPVQSDPFADDLDPRQYDHMAASNPDPFRDLFRTHFRGVLSPQASVAYALEVKRHLSLPNAGLSEEEVSAAMLAGNTPRAGGETGERFGPEKYLSRLLLEKDKADRSRASPRNAPVNAPSSPDVFEQAAAQQAARRAQRLESAT